MSNTYNAVHYDSKSSAYDGSENSIPDDNGEDDGSENSIPDVNDEDDDDDDNNNNNNDDDDDDDGGTDQPYSLFAK